MNVLVNVGAGKGKEGEGGTKTSDNGLFLDEGCRIQGLKNLRSRDGGGCTGGGGGKRRGRWVLLAGADKVTWVYSYWVSGENP